MDKFEYKKSIGQNFMRDENIINKIVDSAGIDKDTLVIEIGPGAGSLSKKIIPLSGYSILYEIHIAQNSNKYQFAQYFIVNLRKRCLRLF